MESIFAIVEQYPYLIVLIPISFIIVVVLSIFVKKPIPQPPQNQNQNQKKNKKGDALEKEQKKRTIEDHVKLGKAIHIGRGNKIEILDENNYWTPKHPKRRSVLPEKYKF